MTRPLDGYRAHRRDRGRGPQRVLHVMTARRLYLARVKEEASFEQILERYGVKTRGAGSKRMALCPFHPDRKPSCSIHLERKVFYCFGCGAKGSVLDFVAQIENVSIPEAAERVEEICRIRHDEAVPQRRKPTQNGSVRDLRLSRSGRCRFGSRSIHRIHIWQEDTSILSSPLRSDSDTAATAPCRAGSAFRSTTNAACSSHTPAAGPATSYRKAFRNTICRATSRSAAFFTICTVSPAPSIWSWSRDIGRSSAFTSSA